MHTLKMEKLKISINTGKLVKIDYSHDEKWFIKKLDELINDSIFLHCRADVEIASYISGGIDSTLVSLLSRIIEIVKIRNHL